MAGPKPGWERERVVHGAGRIVYDTSKYAKLTLLDSYASIEDAVEEGKDAFYEQRQSAIYDDIIFRELQGSPLSIFRWGGHPQGIIILRLADHRILKS